MRFLLSIFFSLQFFDADAQVNYYGGLEFKDTRGDSFNIQLDTVAILGVGSTPARIFLDGLSQKLMTGFKKEKLIASYQYLGKTVNESRQVYNTILKENPKAILLILPTDTAYYGPETYTTSIPLPNNIYGGISINAQEHVYAYAQNFYLKLYVREEKLELIWSAQFQVNCDLSKPNPYASNISQKIIASFKKSMFFKKSVK